MSRYIRRKKEHPLTLQKFLARCSNLHDWKLMIEDLIAKNPDWSRLPLVIEEAHGHYRAPYAIIKCDAPEPMLLLRHDMDGCTCTLCGKRKPRGLAQTCSACGTMWKRITPIYDETGEKIVGLYVKGVPRTSQFLNAAQAWAVDKGYLKLASYVAGMSSLSVHCDRWVTNGKVLQPAKPRQKGIWVTYIKLP